jgi:hypothetical protein
MNSHSAKRVENIETVLEVDRWARVAAAAEIEKLARKPATVV